MWKSQLEAGNCKEWKRHTGHQHCINQYVHYISLVWPIYQELGGHFWPNQLVQSKASTPLLDLQESPIPWDHQAHSLQITSNHHEPQLELWLVADPNTSISIAGWTSLCGKFPPLHRSSVPNHWKSMTFVITFVNRVYVKQHGLIRICFPGFWNKGNTSRIWEAEHLFEQKDWSGASCTKFLRRIAGLQEHLPNKQCSMSGKESPIISNNKITNLIINNHPTSSNSPTVVTEITTFF